MPFAPMRTHTSINHIYHTILFLPPSIIPCKCNRLRTTTHIFLIVNVFYHSTIAYFIIEFIKYYNKKNIGLISMLFSISCCMHIAHWCFYFYLAVYIQKSIIEKTHTHTHNNMTRWIDKQIAKKAHDEMNFNVEPI